VRRNNINAALRIVHSYLDGKSSRIELELDFPYEAEQRYRKMYAEDPEYAELIFDRLVQDGVFCWDKLSDEEFRAKVKETYEDVLDVAKDGFWEKRDFL
jgi:hypothetical protein